MVKGSTSGTITDANGNFSLTKVDGDAILQFSFIGMKAQEVKVVGKSVVNVTMAEETTAIEEVVAIGYGTQKKVNLTGAISTVSSEVFENRSITTAAQALQGKVANLNVVNTGTVPGSKPTFNIRGYSRVGYFIFPSGHYRWSNRFFG